MPTTGFTRRRLATLAVAVGVSAATAGTIAVAPAQGAEPVYNVFVGTHNSHYGDGSFPAFAVVIGWQEVNDPIDRDKMRNQLGADYSHEVFSGAASAVPISWRNARFDKEARSSTKTHDGEAGVTPARFVNAVVLRNRDSGRRFVFVNTHFISGAWNGSHPERQGRWLQHLDTLKAEVTRLRDLHDAPVIVVGDFNRQRAESLLGLRMLDVEGVAGITIDQIYVPDNTTASKSLQLEKYGSDHHAYKAGLDW